MALYKEPYEYHLTIRNLTGKDLAIAEPRRLHGIWFRDGIDGAAPVSAAAGTQSEVLGIRAAANPVKGYEFRCAWHSDGDDPGEVHSVTLYVNVPFISGKNRAGLDVSGPLKVEGWTGVSILGNGFEHTLTIHRAR